MKRFLLGFVFIFSTLVIKAQITWIGTSGGNWNTASNWSPATVPGSTDDVVFNTSVSVNMDILGSSTYSINSLTVTGNANVKLLRTQSGGGDRVLQVKSTSTSTKGLQIDAGCILTIHGENTNSSGTLNYILDLCGAMGVTGEISGELAFSGENSNSSSHGTRLRIYNASPTGYANMVVKNGGIIRYLDKTGNTSSSTGGPYITMESGSQYIIQKNGGSFPDGGSWDSNSLAKVDNASGNSGATFNGTNYGNMEWNCPAQTNISFLSNNVTFNNVTLINTGTNSFAIKTGAASTSFTLTVNGNLTVNSGASLLITGSTVSAGLGGTLYLKGNLDNQGTITSSGGANTINNFELNGTTNQSLSVTGSGAITGSRLSFIMNNAAGATLSSPVTLPFTLSLNSGKIATTSTNLLTMVDGSYCLGGSNTSFVEGPIKKIGDDAFSFPIGIGGIYTPLGITNGTGTSVTDEFTAEYKRINPQTIHGACPTFCDASLDHISFVEYWKLEQNVGSASYQVSLTVHDWSFSKILTKTYISRWFGGKWTNEPTSIASGPTSCSFGNQCGTIQTNSALSSFGDFTLATDETIANNPLPIKLIDFKVQKINNGLAYLTWELAACCSNAAKFEIQKSGDSHSFVSFATVNGSETNRFYAHNDSRLGAGITYYRLKMTDVDGSVTFSKVVAVVNQADGFVITSLSPNPATSVAKLSISSARMLPVSFVIYNAHGAIVKSWSSVLAEGNAVVDVAVARLPAGVYTIMAVSGTSKASIRLVKQ